MMVVLMKGVLTMPLLQLSEMTLDHDDGPAPTGSEEAPSGERKAPAAKPRKKERKRSELRVRWIECANMSSSLALLQDITSQMSSFTTGTRYDPLASSVSMSRYGGAATLMTNPYLAGDEDDGVYRMKYERSMNELDEAKRRLVSQHEEDLEQMMTIKKQMEKKINEAYEEVDEQKRDSAQWKNKYKKAQVSRNIYIINWTHGL